MIHVSSYPGSVVVDRDRGLIWIYIVRLATIMVVSISALYLILLYMSETTGLFHGRVRHKGKRQRQRQRQKKTRRRTRHRKSVFAPLASNVGQKAKPEEGTNALSEVERCTPYVTTQTHPVLHHTTSLTFG